MSTTYAEKRKRRWSNDKPLDYLIIVDAQRWHGYYIDDSPKHELSGAGENWRKYIGPETYVIDTTELDSEAWASFHLRSPMPFPGLEPGTVRRMLAKPEPWTGQPLTSMDYIAMDIFELMAAESGATITIGAPK